MLSIPERLIVAADFKPQQGEDEEPVRDRVLRLAEALRDTGVVIKVNSILRACGYSLLDDITDLGLHVFADLKLFDIGETMVTDGALLAPYAPDILTTVCDVGVDAMHRLRGELPKTEVFGVTILTSLKEEDMLDRCDLSMNRRILARAHAAYKSGLAGVICAPKDLPLLRPQPLEGLQFITPGIRPKWAQVQGDDQNPDRVMTPAEAMKVGATRLVVGRPIIRNESPRDAVNRTLEEMDI